MEKLLEKLILLCKKNNVEFNALYSHRGQWNIVVFDENKAKKLGGIMPEHLMRDELDYRLAMNSWIRAGLVPIACGDTVEEALILAIKHFDK